LHCLALGITSNIQWQGVGQLQLKKLETSIYSIKRLPNNQTIGMTCMAEELPVQQDHEYMYM
jgi:hypothetical protein